MHWGMKMTDRDLFDLETMFEAARASPPEIPPEVSTRILADAAVHQPRPPLWRRAIRAVGGPMGLGGLVTATMAGAWIGVAPPVDGLDPLILLGQTNGLNEEQDLTELYGFGWDLEEG